jgi:hypothetical protein
LPIDDFRLLQSSIDNQKSTMINGNQTWQQGLNALQKEALYVLEIPQFGIILASFTVAQIQSLTQSGWGVGFWGITGWGT